MIIRTMSRKTPSFYQIVRYFDRHNRDQDYNIKHNIRSGSQEDIIEEFLKNSQHIKTRKNGVYMYHEVLSLSKGSKLPKQRQKEILKEIVSEYIKARADKNLVYAVLHDEPNRYLHYHIAISSNERNKQKKLRLPKESFKALKRQTEKYVLQNFPELEQKPTIQTQRPKQIEKISQKGIEQKRRTGELPQREQVKENLGEVLRSKTKQEFFEKLQKYKLGLNEPGKRKYISFKDLTTGRNHRVNTLGLSDQFREMSDRIELETKQPKNKQQEQTKQHKEAAQDQYKQAQGHNEDVGSPSKEQDQKTQQEAKQEQECPEPSQTTEAERPKQEDLAKKQRDEKIKKAEEMFNKTATKNKEIEKELDNEPSMD